MGGGWGRGVCLCVLHCITGRYKFIIVEDSMTGDRQGGSSGGISFLPFFFFFATGEYEGTVQEGR